MKFLWHSNKGNHTETIFCAVPSFYKEADDDALTNVLAVLEDIKDVPDVRKPLESMFTLKKSLKRHITRILGAEYFEDLDKDFAEDTSEVKG